MESASTLRWCENRFQPRSIHADSVLSSALIISVYQNALPFSAEDLQFLRELINPYDNPSQTHPRRFLYDIVANARNSIDVDKFDYLQRDWYEPWDGRDQTRETELCVTLGSSDAMLCLFCFPLLSVTISA